MLKHFSGCFSGFALLLFCSFLSPATATISGVILDEQNAPLMGVTVVAKHVPTSTYRGAITQADGQFNLRNMRSGGPYQLTLSFTGYKTMYRDSLLLKDGQKLALKFKMNPL